MKIQKKTSIAGQWAKLGKDFDEGDLITILDEGNVVSGEYGDALVFKVNTRGGDRNMRFNQTSQNYLVDAFGEDSSSWKGKEVKIWVFDQNISGKMRSVIYLTAKTWKKIRVDGEVKLVSGESESAPSVRETVDDINPDDIPF